MEKSSLDKTDGIIEKEVSAEQADTDILEVESGEEDGEEMQGEVRDSLEPMLKREREKAEEKRRKKEEKDCKYAEEQKRFEKDRKRQLRIEFWKGLWQNFLNLLNPDTYAEIVQRFERLMFTIFVDTILMVILLSILYCSYIILNFETYDWKEFCFKFGASIILCVICIIIQVNLPSDKPKSGEQI